MKSINLSSNEDFTSEIEIFTSSIPVSNKFDTF